MKHKYKLINKSMFDETPWVEMFEKQAHQDWMLEKVGIRCDL